MIEIDEFGDIVEMDAEAAAIINADTNITADICAAETTAGEDYSKSESGGALKRPHPQSNPKEGDKKRAGLSLGPGNGVPTR